MPEPLKDGVYRDPRSGAVVHVRGGQVLLSRGGTVFPVKPEQAGNAILSGDYAAASAEDLAAAEAAKKPGPSIGDKATALAEHAATGVYGGATAIPRALGGVAETMAKDAGVPMSGPSVSALSEEALAAAVGGKDYAKRRAERAAESPYAAAIGEAIGQTAGALALGPATGLGKAAPRGAVVDTAARDLAAASRATALEGGATALASDAVDVGAAQAAKAAAGRAGVAIGDRAAQAAAAGLEGAGLGGAQVIEDAYITRTDLTGEKMVAAMGAMTLLGAGLSVGASAAGKMLQRRAALASGVAPEAATATEASSSTASAWLRQFSEERAIKALGARGSDIRKLGRTGEAAERNMRTVAREVLESKLPDGRPVFRAMQSQDELLESLGVAESAAGQKLGQFRKDVWRHVESDPDLRPDLKGFLDRVREDIIGPLRSSGVAEVQAKAGMIESKLDEIADIGWRSELKAGPSGRRVVTPIHGEPTLEQLTKYRQDLASIAYPKPAGPGLAPLPHPAAEQLVKLERELEGFIEASTDKAAASMKGGKPGEYLAAKTKWRALHQAKQIAEKADLQDLGNRVVSPSDYLTGAAGAIVGGAATGGVGAAVSGLATAAAHKAVREHSSAMLAVLAERMAKALDGQVDEAVAGLLSKAKAPARLTAGEAAPMRSPIARPVAATAFASSGESARDAYARRVQEVHAAQPPATQTRQLAASLGAIHEALPKTGLAAQDTAIRAHAFLASKIATSADDIDGLTGKVEPGAVTDDEIDTFKAYWDAVDDPLSVLRSASRGQLVAEQVEALKEVYPALYDRIRFVVSEQLASGKHDPPYETRIQLDLLLDLNGRGEPTLSPEFQRTLAMVSETPEAGPEGAPRGGGSGRVNPRMANAYQTTATQVEAGL